MSEMRDGFYVDAEGDVFEVRSGRASYVVYIGRSRGHSSQTWAVADSTLADGATPIPPEYEPVASREEAEVYKSDVLPASFFRAMVMNDGEWRLTGIPAGFSRPHIYLKRREPKVDVAIDLAYGPGFTSFSAHCTQGHWTTATTRPSECATCGEAFAWGKPKPAAFTPRQLRPEDVRPGAVIESKPGREKTITEVIDADWVDHLGDQARRFIAKDKLSGSLDHCRVRKDGGHDWQLIRPAPDAKVQADLLDAPDLDALDSKPIRPGDTVRAGGLPVGAVYHRKGFEKSRWRVLRSCGDDVEVLSLDYSCGDAVQDAGEHVTVVSLPDAEALPEEAVQGLIDTMMRHKEVEAHRGTRDLPVLPACEHCESPIAPDESAGLESLELHRRCLDGYSRARRPDVYDLEAEMEACRAANDEDPAKSNHGDWEVLTHQASVDMRLVYEAEDARQAARESAADSAARLGVVVGGPIWR